MPSSPNLTASPSTRRERLAPGERRRRILDAAVDVFGRFGYRDGSLSAVATRAGMTVPGLLHHFPSKVDLLFATLAEWERIQTAALDAAVVDTAYESGRAILERNLEVPGMMRLRVTLTAEATSEDHPAYARMIERYERTEKFYIESIKNDVQVGVLSASLDITHAARALIALLDGLQSQHLLNPQLDLLATYEFAARALLQPHTQNLPARS